MSLYDDEDVNLPESSAAAVTGWSKSVNWMQSQQMQTLVTKKAAAAAAAAAANTPLAVGAVGRARGVGISSFGGAGASEKSRALPPVINLQKSKKGTEEVDVVPRFSYGGGDKFRGANSLLPLKDPSWIVANEYDPLWPNDYHKVVQDMRETKPDDDGSEVKKRRYMDASKDRARERFRRDENLPAGAPPVASGFSRRPNDEFSDHEDDDGDRRGQRRKSDRDGGDDRNFRHLGSPFPSSSSAMGAGAAIAPPPSLTESSDKLSSTSLERGDSPPEMSMLQKMASTPASATGIAGLGVAAKIMAKYGYKHGQGLGRSEQGMSKALSVEKTSKRGGRIVHEKDLMPPPPLFGETSTTPPRVTVQQDEDAGPSTVEKLSITDLMKYPTKVVLAKNMVGPGEVDADLEPEVMEECHAKYGEVHKVVIFELGNVVPEEAVRIFIEFSRVESAIKAVVDLNGRFFGGREVTATFYDVDKFQNLHLTG